MNSLRLVLTLTLTAAVLGGLVAGVAHYTLPRIEANRQLEASKHMIELQEFAREFASKQPKSQAENNDCSMQPAMFEESSKGYGGDINLIAAFYGVKLIRMRVTNHSETPGFAEVLEPGDWIEQFGMFDIRDVDTVSRATVTTSAVLRAAKTLNSKNAERLVACAST